MRSCWVAAVRTAAFPLISSGIFGYHILKNKTAFYDLGSEYYDNDPR